MSDETMVAASDIPWTFESVERPEDVPEPDLLAFDYPTLLVYATDLRADLQAVRALLHQALAAVSDLTAQTTRQRARIARTSSPRSGLPAEPPHER